MKNKHRVIITVANSSLEVVDVTISALFWVALVLSLDVAALAVLRASCKDITR